MGSNILCKTSARLRDAAQLLDVEKKRIAAECAVFGQFVKRGNDNKLSTRCNEILGWKDHMCDMLPGIDKMQEALSERKKEKEQMLNVLNDEMEKVSLCLTKREQKGPFLDVKNYGQKELVNGLKIIQDQKKMLFDMIHEDFVKIEKLSDLRRQLVKRIEDLQSAADVDMAQQKLCIDNEQAMLCFARQKGVDSQAKGSSKITWIDCETWKNLNREISHSIKFELEKANSLLDANRKLVDTIRRDMVAQKSLEVGPIRRHVHETKSKLKNLCFELNESEAKMKYIYDDVRYLDGELKKTREKLKLAQTRLYNRCDRPNSEQTRDNVHYGLIKEIEILKSMISKMEEKMKDEKEAINRLEWVISKIRDDIGCQRRLLDIDGDVLTILKRPNDSDIYAKSNLTTASTTNLAESTDRVLNTDSSELTDHDSCHKRTHMKCTQNCKDQYTRCDDETSEGTDFENASCSFVDDNFFRDHHGMRGSSMREG